ncbi:hypothetical protein [Saccharopolyspora griseoalba]|uniref:TrbL/VirB6 plasmid conjugal transfer protein n=1 Tax=Saccharopolyspora griseoalba TaxID=1431848 RepID=A0ABW2LTP1_9PSEU
MAMCDKPEMMMVCATNPAMQAGDLIGQAAGSAAGKAFNEWMQGMADAMLDAMGKMMGYLWTWWVHIPTPGISATQGPVAQIQHHLAWYMFIFGFLGLLIGAAKLALADNGGQQLRETGQGLGRWILLSTAGTAGLSLAVQAGDAFSTWIIHRAAGKDLGAAVGGYLLFSSTPGASQTLIIILALIALIAAFVQAALMFVRAGMLVLCAGVLPLAAAAGIGGGAGKKTLDKILAWMIAFVLFKPTAAVVYAASFWTISADDPNAQLAGIFMVVLASCAMPALMRVITPHVEGLTGSGGSSGAGMAAGQAAASGARMLSSGSGSSSAGRSGGGGGGGGHRPGLTSPSGAGGSTGASTAKTAAATKTAGAATAAAGPVGAVAAVGLAGKKAAQSAADRGSRPNDQDQPSGSQGSQGGKS